MKEKNFNQALEDLMAPIVEKLVNQTLTNQQKNYKEVKDPEQFLTIGQAAKEFGCSTHLLQKAITNLELDYYKPENRTYIKRIDVHEYLQSIRIRSNDNKENYAFLQ